MFFVSQQGAGDEKTDHNHINKLKIRAVKASTENFIHSSQLNFIS